MACSALFTSEEAFERHKEFHPSIFPDQSDAQSTTQDSMPPVHRRASTEMPGSAPKDTSERDSELHEKNLKLDVANQLLELHKIPQHMTSPGKTSSSGFETMSESGDEVHSPPKQSSPAAQGVAVRSQATATVMPLLAYQGASIYLPSAGHMEKRSATPPRATDKRNGFHDTRMAEENTVRFSYSPQLSPQGVEYLKLPFQNGYRMDRGNSSPAAEMNVNGGVSPVRRSPSPGRNFSVQMFEQQKQTTMDQEANGAHYIANTHQQFDQHFAVRAASTSQRRSSNFLEHISRGENTQQGNAVMQKPSQSNNSVPCHRVSVIQFHSSVQKPAHDTNKQKHSLKAQDTSDPEPNVLPPSEPATMRLESKPPTDHQNQELPWNHSPVDKEYLSGIPQERIPYVPLNSDSSIALHSWNRELDELVGKYSWALKEAKKTYEKLKIREQAMQVSSNHPTENKQFNVFSQANTQQPTGLLDRSQVTSVDMLKFLAREQIKQKDAERDVKSPASVGEESETSEASVESGDASNSGQIYSDERQQSSPSDSLGKSTVLSVSVIRTCILCDVMC